MAACVHLSQYSVLVARQSALTLTGGTTTRARCLRRRQELGKSVQRSKRDRAQIDLRGKRGKERAPICRYKSSRLATYTGKETTKGRREAYMKHKAGEVRSERRHQEGRGHIGTTLQKMNQNLGDLETRRLGNSETRQLGNLATQHIDGSAHWWCGTSRPTSYAKTRGRTSLPGSWKKTPQTLHQSSDPQDRPPSPTPC